MGAATPISDDHPDGKVPLTGGQQEDDGRTVALLRLLVDVAAGSLLPLAAAALLLRAEDPEPYRPGTILLAIVVVLAALLGFRAGLVAASVSTVALWSQFSAAGGPFTGVSVTVFVLAATVVLLLVSRLDRTRHEAHVQRSIADALIAGAPVGIAMLDTSLTLERVNPTLAEMTGVAADDQVGLTPREVDPVLGVVQEEALEQVRSTGEPLTDHAIDFGDPAHGSERHWRASYYPVRVDDAELIGFGATLEDLTPEVVARRRSTELLSLARDLAGVLDDAAFTSTVATFLGEIFGARCVVGTVEPRGLQLHGPGHGYPTEVADVWTAGPVPLPAPGLMGEAIALRRTLSVDSGAEFDATYPDLADARALIGDEACLCVPILDPVDDSCVGLIRLAWTNPRPVTDTSRTFCETVASMGALARRRIQLSADLERDRFRSALDAMLDLVSIGTAVRDADGTIVDFRIDHVSAGSSDWAGRTAEDLVGRSLLEVYPRWRQSGVFDAHRAVVDNGVPWIAERMPYRDTLPDGTTVEGWWNVQVARLDDGYISAARDVTDVVRLEAAEREAQRLAERERSSVQLLQRAALPSRLPHVGSAAIGATYQPADTEQPVGGDWFDAFDLGDGRLALVIADVAGHGPDAAAVMVQVRNILRAVALDHDDPDDVLQHVNEVASTFAEHNGPFVTCCYGVLEADGSRFSWAAAGHPPPLVVAEGECTFPPQLPGLPLAVSREALYSAQHVDLSAGDRLVLYTDGLVERRGELLDLGLERLRIAVAAAPQLGSQELADALGASVIEPVDDLAVLVVDVVDRAAD